MKKIFFWILLVPFIAISQNANEYLVFENGLLSPKLDKITQFESGLASHNKKYHNDGTYGARVYWIGSGPNTGKYMWVMGPLPWSAFDTRPEKEGHDEDWNTNVLQYMLPDTDQIYWKFEAGLSNFPKDFKLNKLLVDFYDVKPFQGSKAMALLEKIKKVMTNKFPAETYGVYTNELPNSKDGNDIAFISFYEKSGWMGEDWKFADKYNEVHGAGSFDTFLKDWENVTQGKYSEIWHYKPKLSGLSGDIKAANRQPK
jgi:hypothetical protein